MLDDFDFDEWEALYRKSPGEFEKQRALMLERFINEQPEYMQEKLRELQRKIEVQRMIATDPMDALMRIQNMLWESYGEVGQVMGDMAIKNSSELTDKK